MLTPELSGPLPGRPLSDSGVSGSYTSYGLPVAASPAHSTPAFSAPLQLLPAGGQLGVQQQGLGSFLSVAAPAAAGVTVLGPICSSAVGHAAAGAYSSSSSSSSASPAAPVPLPSPSNSFGAPDSSTLMVHPRLPAGQQHGPGGVSGQLMSTLGRMLEPQPEDPVDVTALAAAVAQEKLAQLQQIEDAQRALLDDILELLPLI